MCEKCKKCHENPAISSGFCIECLADEWGKIIDSGHPMISPQSLIKTKTEK
ncbi:MAG: hypothetical protein WC788_00100 [Candidatus Paceibacterota bacterium]|jgi:hypothetical protein